MINKILVSVFNFMTSTYVVVILTIITDVHMYMEDMVMENGIYGFEAFISYTFILPVILMMFYKCLPYVIASIIGLVIALVVFLKVLIKYYAVRNQT